MTDRDTTDRFDIHRLMRFAMRNWVRTKGQQSRQITKVVYQLSARFPWPIHENRAVLEFRGDCTEKEKLGLFQHNIAQVFYVFGKYEEVEQMHRATLALREKVLGPEHPSTLDSMNNLASKRPVLIRVL
ncbi:uncharacterized protein PpBr36_10659 [Pyricularia pennisetigena]|uniref:uncharacterized protein n=1 Tax=Pyricularia pennisetigena TaxID=1578925 RepID=UPI0011535E81|nr:uncharacterized protein PpBr36_10659 [Pyricularia pennisetigena]TLS21187.1 hypothetical protein PpBr36_10659 [Pyricularia pennisetigena]